MSSPLPVNAANPARYGACELRNGSLKSSKQQMATGGANIDANLQYKGSLNASSTNCPSLADVNSTVDEEAALDVPNEPKTFIMRMADRVPCLGILMALCASFFLGSAGMLVKMTRSVHGIQVAVLR